MDNFNIESEALILARAYLGFYRKYSVKTFSIKNVKKTKWWPFFIKTVDNYSYLKDWNSYIWVSCQFEKYGKIFPTQLCSNEAFKTFEEYKHIFQTNNEEILTKNVVSTLRLIEEWSKENTSVNFDISSFLKNKNNLFKMVRGNINCDAFVVVKDFYNIDDKIKNSIMTEGEIAAKRIMIMNSEKIKKILIRILKDKFI